MKSFKEYLSESKKTYPFKIVVAGDLPEGFDSRVRTAMEKFGLSSMSGGKKTPIQERPLDFPQLENMEVTFWDVEVNYPTTEAVIKNYLGQFCSVHESHIAVKNPNHPLEEQNKQETDTTYETLLTKEDLGGESAQNSVGNNRIMDLLKELETARKERADSTDGFKAEAMKEEPQNTKSAMGS
jgi:hypothetical protein